MPTGYNYKENQKGAGVSKPMPGPDNSIKTMGGDKSTIVKPAFKLVPPVYKGNPVLNANK
jgi:hypothetical protein